MDYRNVGSAGLRVSPLCLGTMNFGDPVDASTGAEIIRRFVEHGGTFIDTANVYHKGRSEEIVGKALRGIRDLVVLATKGNRPMGDGPNDRGSSRKHILIACRESLRRLNTDHIDLYWIHRPDAATPIEETLAALDTLVKKGDVLYVGCSTFPAWQTVEALWASDRRHLVRFVAEQPPYSILERRVETRVLPMCAQHGLGVVPWSPLAGGWLAGAYRPGDRSPTDTRARSPRWSASRLFATSDAWAERRFEVVETLRPMAAELGVSLAVFSVAWLLGNPIVTAPIIGPRTVEHLDELLQAVDTQIPAPMRETIDRLVAPGESLWFADDPEHVI